MPTSGFPRCAPSRRNIRCSSFPKVWTCGSVSRFPFAAGGCCDTRRWIRRGCGGCVHVARAAAVEDDANSPRFSRARPESWVSKGKEIKTSGYCLWSCPSTGIWWVRLTNALTAVEQSPTPRESESDSQRQLRRMRSPNDPRTPNGEPNVSWLALPRHANPSTASGNLDSGLSKAAIVVNSVVHNFVFVLSLSLSRRSVAQRVLEGYAPFRGRADFRHSCC